MPNIKIVFISDYIFTDAINEHFDIFPYTVHIMLNIEPHIEMIYNKKANLINVSNVLNVQN